MVTQEVDGGFSLFHHWRQRFQRGKRAWLRWLLILPGAAILYIVDLHLAPEWLSPQLADFGTRKLTISQGQELILQGFSPQQQGEPVLLYETRGELDIDLTFENARLEKDSIEALQMRGMKQNIPRDAQEIRYLSLDTPREGEPCHNSFLFSTGDGNAPQELRLSQPQENLPSDRFRSFQARFSQGSLVAQLVAPLSLGGPGLSCRKRLQIGNTDLNFVAPFNYQVVVAGGEIRFSFERLTGDPSGQDESWPANLLAPVRAKAVKVVDLGQDRAETILKGRNGKPTIEVASLSLGADQMQVQVKGEGSIRGQQAPHFLDGFQERPISVGALMTLLLAMNGSVIAFAGSLALSAIKGPPSTKVQIFVSYSRKDAQYLKEIQLVEFMRGLEKEEVGVELWMDKEIMTGARWDEVITEQIRRSDIALLLVSQSYLDSEYCNKEVRALQKKVIVPIILSPCDLEPHQWLTEVQLPHDAAETLEGNYQDSSRRKELFVKIRKDLKKKAQEIRQEKDASLPLLHRILRRPRHR